MQNFHKDGRVVEAARKIKYIHTYRTAERLNKKTGEVYIQKELDGTIGYVVLENGAVIGATACIPPGVTGSRRIGRDIARGRLLKEYAIEIGALPQDFPEIRGVVCASDIEIFMENVDRAKVHGLRNSLPNAKSSNYMEELLGNLFSLLGVVDDNSQLVNVNQGVVEQLDEAGEVEEVEIVNIEAEDTSDN